MRFALVYGKYNIAGKNIAEDFKKIAYAPQIPIIELDKDGIYADDINEKKYPELRNIDFVIIASTHRSEKNFPSLCLHAPGNWRNADLGGKPGIVCPTSAFVLKYLFIRLNEIAEKSKQDKELSEDYNVTMEATHHGPHINIPCCFIEVGSNEINWNDRNATTVIAKVINTLQDYPNYISSSDWLSAIAIGGPHYCPNFNKIQLKSEYAIGHVIASYASPITENMFIEAEQKTIERIKEVLIDWKAYKSEERANILNMLKKLNFSYVRN
ncbi:MAG: D-aminoacyl-tRNA deacylase [Nanoarchaeota archaeon]|nr:D-aminoacyl-tRNA deacylase [Nanoarchaeota archaeon]